jgi:acetoin utilization protein AcuB
MEVRAMVGVVRDHMTTAVQTLTEDAPLRRAVELVLVRRVRHVPIVDAAGAMVGIVTDRDVMRALPSPLSPIARQMYESLLENTPVTKVMTREPITVGAQVSLREAVVTMLERKISGLPVVENGRLAGMLTQTDALRAYLGLPRKGAAEQA